MDRKDIILIMAKAMAIANEAEEQKPDAYWTEATLFSHGYYGDADKAYQALLDANLVVQPKRAPPRDSVEALAVALKATFPVYRRVSAAEAAVEIVEALAKGRHEIRHLVGLPRG